MEYPADYFAAREQFRKAAASLGLLLESHPIQARGPHGEALTIDVACTPPSAKARTLVLSSGLHGIEGFFGSAVQLALLEYWAKAHALPQSIRLVLIHALNPYGYAFLRRCDANNVDLNRNFLLENEPYRGSPTRYRQLNQLLNPECFQLGERTLYLKFLFAIFRFGWSPVKQAIVGGQYDFPRGLFYGGSGPSETLQLFNRHLRRWIEGSEKVVHIDLHTGLGKPGTYKLLLDRRPDDDEMEQLRRCFGANSFEAPGNHRIAYQTRGSFGEWCLSRNTGISYFFTVAEFGTHNPLKILAGLRAENYTHHCLPLDHPSTVQAKKRLKQLFMPSTRDFLQLSLKQALTVSNQATELLEMA